MQPRYSSPRYLSHARRRIGTWRFAPAGLAAGVAGMLVLTAYAATGSPNPVVWTQKILTTIEPVVVPESIPTSAPSLAPTPHEAVPPPADEPEPTERPEPSDGPATSSTPGRDGGDDTEIDTSSGIAEALLPTFPE